MDGTLHSLALSGFNPQQDRRSNTRFWVILGSLFFLVGCSNVTQQKEEGTEARRLFNKMEERLRQAKTIQLNLKIRVEGPEGAGSATGRFSLAPGNKLRLEWTVALYGQKSQQTLVSSGKRLELSGTDIAGPGIYPTPPYLTQRGKAALGRSGLVAGVFLLTGMAPNEHILLDTVDPGKMFRVSRVEMAKGEDLQPSSGNVISYCLESYDANRPVALRLWLDKKSGLPQKRILLSEEKGEKYTSTEEYSNLIIDGKIPAGTFRLSRDD